MITVDIDIALNAAVEKVKEADCLCSYVTADKAEGYLLFIGWHMKPKWDRRNQGWRNLENMEDLVVLDKHDLKLDVDGEDGIDYARCIKEIEE